MPGGLWTAFILIYINYFGTDCKLVKWLVGDKKMKKIMNAYQVAQKIQKDLYQLCNQTDMWEIKFIVAKH